MPELMASKKNKKNSFIPCPGTMGVFMAIIGVTAIAAGTIRSESALVLVGAIIAIVFVYLYAAVLFLSIIYRGKISSLSAQLIPSEISAGHPVEVFFSGAGLARKGPVELPGVLIRYELHIKTNDSRYLHCVTGLSEKARQHTTVDARFRGAYFGKNDAVRIFDVLGFFSFSIYIPQNEELRLGVTPGFAGMDLDIPARSGGSERREDPHFIRTDDLIDHRQYVPGDDPRRINWKLYGHIRELFIRQGEPEPPPKSKLVIIIDASADETLYNPEAGSAGVDVLCGYALAIALEYSNRGMDVLMGYNGSSLKGGKGPELSSMLAFPYASKMKDAQPLPLPEDPRAVLILALPRETAGAGALDNFLKKKSPGQSMDVWFIYTDDREGPAAELCSRMYSQKGGVYAKHIKAV